jgi:hypothetical protein
VELNQGPYILTLHDDPLYTAGSADNVERYDREYCFSKENRASSKCGMICQRPDGTTDSCILLGGGGASGVHDHSAVVVKDSCFVGVGDMLCALFLPTLDLRWATKVDWATCFGVYYSPQHDCLLSHGELEIARVSLGGQIIWSAGGMDIFTEGFHVVGDYVEALDFNRTVYRIDIATGRSAIVHGPTKGGC